MDELVYTAYEDIWKQLGRRFGYTDALRDATRRFDSRRQRDNESLQEVQQAIRFLHSEGWPTKTPEQRDAVLKRRFEDGLSNTSPPTPRYDSVPTQSPRSTNPFQDNCVEQYSHRVPP